MNLIERMAFLAIFFIAISCEKHETSLGTMEGQNAIVSSDLLLVAGADRARRDIEGEDFSCPEAMTYCRRAIAALYDDSFRRIALFEKDFPAVDLRVSAYRRGAGGYYLVAVDERWFDVPARTGDTAALLATTESRPFFHVTVVTLSAALDELGAVSFPSIAGREIHAAFVTAAGDLYLAGLDDTGALFIERHDAESEDEGARWPYPAEKEGRVVFLSGIGGTVHLVRSTGEGGYRYLVINGEGAVTNAVSLDDGDTIDPDPETGARGIAAVLREDGLYWFGEDDNLYRLASVAGAVTLETLATLDTSEGISYQRDVRFVEGDLYLIGANDRAVHGSGCGYGEITTHETELVIMKFDASFARLWEDRETEGADYHALEVVAWDKERYFVFQKNDRVLIRPTD